MREAPPPATSLAAIGCQGCTETKPARWRPELDVDDRATADELVAALNQRMAPIRVRRADAIRHAIAFALDAERRFRRQDTTSEPGWTPTASPTETAGSPNDPAQAKATGEGKDPRVSPENLGGCLTARETGHPHKRARGRGVTNPSVALK